MAEAYPLCWPDGWKRTQYRKNSAFKITAFGKARDLLLAEVRRMGAANVVLSTNISLRNDGLPYANQRNPDDPGVAIYFVHKKRRMCFACDAYRKVEENAYAIAKTIEALRGIERWGASDMMERAFTGFAALPETTDHRKWWDILAVPNTASAGEISDAYRSLARTRHPDAGGSHDLMAELNAARDEAMRERTQ